ncbi:uncharacterized protein LOC134682123 [Mytilus trossulus]|uniref:uncharacterized protein LOC134682123 n=1 Tax=Mytilus trossulus TaxID=6551 RepID=UPI003003E669
MLCLFLSLFLPIIRCFLIDRPHNESGNLLSTSQYVTEAEFLKETTFIHQEAGQIRTFVEKSLALLTSQLQPKFNILDQLHQKFENLEHKLSKCENHSESTVSLEQKYTDLEQKYNKLKFDYNLIKLDLDNKTTELNQKITDIKQLDNIKPLSEFKILQQTVQAVSAQTHSLSINERARSQDFLALYNMTMDSKRVLYNLENRQNTTEADLSNELKKLETKTNTQLLIIEQSQNSTAADIITRMEAKEISDKLTMSMVQKQINNNAERVAISAHPLTSRTITNTIMRFNEVRYSVGITNLAAFKSTGKFVCEHVGLYLISASVMSYTSGARYRINLNGNDISETRVGQHSSNYDHTGGVTVTRKLNPNDQVWLYAIGSLYLTGGIHSTFTIIKVK